MQTMPVNRIFNEWKKWVLVVQPQSCPSLSKTISIQVTYQRKFGFIKLHGHLIHFILIIDLLYIVQKAEDCVPNCLCQRT